MTDEAEFTDPDEWPDPVLRERVARALSWHSDGQDRDDYQYFRGYWLGAADMALRASGLAELTSDRDRARDVAVALEQELAGYDARVEAALKQVMRTASMVDARDQAAFTLAGWQTEGERGSTPFSEQVLDIGRQELAERERYRLAALREFQRPDTAPSAEVDWPDIVRTRLPFNPHEYANTPVPAYDSSGESHPFEGTDEACARCGLIRAAPYHGDPVAAAAYRAGYQHAEGIERIDALQQAAAVRARTEQAPDLDDPAAPPEANIAAVRSDDARRPVVVVGEWVRILERPAGLPAGQIGKAMPPGFTPPSTPASRVIAVKVGPGHPIDASAWEVIDHPGRRECPECCAELGLGEKHADDCDRAI